MMNRTCLFSRLLAGLCLMIGLALPQAVLGQENTGSVRGHVADPTGAVIPQAQVTVTSQGGQTIHTTSDSTGSFQLRGLAPGDYSVNVSSPGFATFSGVVSVSPGQTRTLNVGMQIQTEQQQVQVEAEAPTVDTTAEGNANAIVLKGKDLDALSDDPDEMENELQALAGPSAGPNGGEIYIDGFTGGQLPPKSSIREIRINQNPFSAEFDRLGYGRIEIFTKPGTDKLHGQIEARGNDSAFNSKNPILQTAEPGYYSYELQGSVGGPISKNSSYFVSALGRNTQNVNVVDAVTPTGNVNLAYPNPSSRLDFSPRLDLQLGSANTLTVRYEFYRVNQTNEGVGQLSLPEQASNSNSIENDLQVSDSIVISKNLVDDVRFQYRRFRTETIPASTAPTVTVQGSFVDGGSADGTVRDNQDIYELQNYFAGAYGNHSLNFGGRLRAYRDANFTNSGANGAFTFSSLTNYENNTPQTFRQTIIHQYTARATLFDGALFYQDDWKVNPRFTFSYGLRWETQNWISDKSDFGPRVSFALALDHGNGQPKTVLRAGYGWFYERFTVPNSFGSLAGTPYVIQAIHQNGVNQQVVIENYSASGPTSAPTVYTVDPHFHAALDMQGAIGIDRQIAKRITGNVTYLYGRGVHQYLTNNVTAPFFATADEGIYPADPLSPAAENNFQFQSGGVYRQNEIIVTGSASYPRFSFRTFYTHNDAKGDTSGVNSIPSVAQKPGLDYGRTTFDVQNRFVLLGNFMAPYGFAFTPFFAYNSGTPYSITIGSDLTQNNAFNARPTFAASCDEPNVVSTAYGCLNVKPFGTNEKIVPVGLATGPSNYSLNLRVSKVIGIGPRLEGGGNRGVADGGGRGNRGGGFGSSGLSGNRGGGPFMNGTTTRKYNLTLTAFATNLFNHQNLGPENGTLSSPLFGTSQTLAGQFFGPHSAGNRSIFLQAIFNF